GGEAKAAIAEGAVTINGEVDTRRGASVRAGDRVCIGNVYAVVTTVDDDDDDYFDEATADDDFDPEKWRNLYTMPAFMSEVGMPCWIDLTTSNPEKPAKFYREVLGWEVTAETDEYRIGRM